jgi:hypothetical protein
MYLARRCHRGWAHNIAGIAGVVTVAQREVAHAETRLQPAMMRARPRGSGTPPKRPPAENRCG